MRVARVQFSLRLLMIAVAVIGFAMFAVREMFFANTVYATGYDESHFRQVCVGMTSEDVEALMGPPLRKIPWWPDRDLVCWAYTARRRGGDYWRRDVFIKDGKVVQIVGFYWVD